MSSPGRKDASARTESPTPTSSEDAPIAWGIGVGVRISAPPAYNVTGAWPEHTHLMADRELSARLAELVRPTPTDVRRARKAVMRILDDGAPHRMPRLVEAAVGELGVVRRPGPLQVRFDAQVHPERIPVDDPTVAFLRAWLAGAWTISDLAVHDLVIPAVADVPGETSYDRLAEGGDVRVGIIHSHGAHSVDVPVVRPALAPVYVKSPAAGRAPAWFLDPDVFLEDLRTLPLDERALRTLREALEAFRRGLYLAATALLGVVSEAAWYAAARRLGNPGGLAQTVSDGATAKVQRRVAEILRGVPGAGTTVDELHALAAFLRELRNYGVHPVPVRDDLDRHFSEEGCGLLILRIHSYLVRLAGMVEQALVTAARPL